MGTYLHPGNSGFMDICKGMYVDKTGLIDLINQTIGTTDKLTCISRPRRFGKSFAAQMLCAYYDCSCDSGALFDHFQIAETKRYREHLNQYHVISLDISAFISSARRRGKSLCEVPDEIVDNLEKELKKTYPDLPDDASFQECMQSCCSLTGKKFVFIIDEWDAMIREAKNDRTAQERYLDLLREWFKNNNFTPRVVAAAYMTGILPIKKDGSQSAISDFNEYSFITPGRFAAYTGFTQDEVKTLCLENGMDFENAKKWYDGYSLGSINEKSFLSTSAITQTECQTEEYTESVYNPYSVMCAMKNHRFASYWKKTSAAEALLTYIDMNQDGLQDDIVRLIAGEEIEVNTESFENDFETFGCKDDVLTLLIHLGYLSYCEKPAGYDEDAEDEMEMTGFVRIPNEEVRMEFRQILRKGSHAQLLRLIQTSDHLLMDTISGNEEAVAKAISQVRLSEYAPNFYNDEQALRYVIKFAYISCVDQYLKVEEMPSGKGLADVVFVPKRHSQLPAMIVELKWNKTPETGLTQIKEKEYPAVLKKYGGDLLFVAVSYDAKTKDHHCKIEKLVI